MGLFLPDLRAKLAMVLGLYPCSCRILVAMMQVSMQSKLPAE